MGDNFYRGVVTTARGLFRTMGYRIDIRGAENIPLEGGAVLAINHISYIDFVFAGIPANERNRRLVRFMAKESVFRNKVSGPLMRSMSHIPVDRSAGMASFRAAVEVLKSGELVGVFPEATLSRSFEIREIKSGAVRMARAAKVPLIPVVVFGTQRISGYDHTSLSRKIPVLITVGEPLPVDGNPDEAALALRATLQAMLDETIARYPERPAPGEDPWWLPARLGGSAPTLEEANAMDAEEAAGMAAKRAAQAAEAAEPAE